MKNKRNLKETGITLVALVITIIILLILAGITIASLTENGLFEKAKLAQNNTLDAQIKENKILEEYVNYIDNYNKEEVYNENSKTRYILVEVYDHISGEGVAISELRFYDKEGNKISYNILENEAFDSVSEGLPAYWKQTVWDYSNLYDNAITNTSIQEGGQNCTALLFSASAGSLPNSDNFARFVIDLGEERELENINICLGDFESRIPKSISLYEIENYSNETYSKNVVQRNNEGLSLIKTIDFSSVVTTPTWYSFIGDNQRDKFLVEIYDHITGDGVSISELEIYDKKGNIITYNVFENEAFDSVSGGLPTYWKQSAWDYSNLYDNAITNTSIPEGGQNCTALLFSASAGSLPNSNNFARFIIEPQEKISIDDIKICIGDSESRTPKSMSIYKIDNYSSETYLQNITQRNNRGLKLLKTVEFSSAVTTPTWYSFIK